MMKRLLTASAALLFVAACEQTPVEAPVEAPVAFAAAEVTVDPFSGTFNFCGEDVDLEGTWQTNTKSDITPGGQVSGHTNYVVRVSGYGQTSGARYVATQTGNFSFHFDPADGVPATFNDLVTLRFLGLGDAPDYTYKFRAHFTVDATGVIRVDRFDESSGCS
jgi:hypothetical protein